MSYICKGNIPKNCSKCPQRTLYHGINVCLAADKMKVSTSNKYRHDNCPLVEIPTPHGRLIDADKLLESFREALDEDRHFVNFFALVDDSPTVIDPEVTNGVFYSTDIKEKLGAPLGEWP